MQVNALLSPTRRCTNDVLFQGLTNHESVTIRHEKHGYLRLDWLEVMLSDRYPQLSFTSHVHAFTAFESDTGEQAYFIWISCGTKLSEMLGN